MKKQTSQDFFTSPCPWNEGLIIDHLSNEFGKTQGDIARLEKRIDEINFSGSCTDSGNTDRFGSTSITANFTADHVGKVGISEAGRDGFEEKRPSP